MAEQSKEADPKTTEEALTEVLTLEQGNNEVAEEGSQADADDTTVTEGTAKKKKSKKAKLKKALGRTSIAEDGPSANAEGSSAAANPASKLTPNMVQQLLEMNPSLKSEVAGMSQEQAAQKIKSLEVADLITGMVRCQSHLYYQTSNRAIVRIGKESEGHGFVQILADTTCT